ncbi:uncharacterized protein LOC132754195 [Ruditapes philippinarum]|uniref:uncharacterized protein LOC132754195 n=1 Tax=Ruditapes philippinarum TaxID=129788 RepID=UPI00295B6599|nr:uncharacterized protein LOC132754195 [Ruditapes philippinarum]
MATSSTYGDDIDTDTVHFKCSESVITCQICMDIFESPRILPCQHTFCKKCVVSLVTKHCLDDVGNTSKASFPCPNCRRDCKIRQKGKHSIEEHLKCFPESLLLNTVLDSIEEKPRSHSDESVTDSEHEKCTNSNDKNLQCDAKEIQRLSFVTILFYLRLLDFIRDVHVSYSNSLNSVTKTTYVYLLRDLIRIPSLPNTIDIRQHPVFYLHDIQNNGTKEAAMIEKEIMPYISYLGLYEDDIYEIMNKDAQTQTDDEYVNFLFLSTLVFKFLLLKSSSLVAWLFLFLFRNANGKSFDFSLHYSLRLRKIRYWRLFYKVFDISTMLYASEQSFLWPFSLVIVCYILLLAFFKRIKNLVSGGVNIGNTLPFFPIFLISLNFFSNIVRCYLYTSCIVYSYYWIFGKLLLFEFLHGIIQIIVIIIFFLCGKMHYKYGPFVHESDML